MARHKLQEFKKTAKARFEQEFPGYTLNWIQFGPRVFLVDVTSPEGKHQVLSYSDYDSFLVDRRLKRIFAGYQNRDFGIVGILNYADGK